MKHSNKRPEVTLACTLLLLWMSSLQAAPFAATADASTADADLEIVRGRVIEYVLSSSVDESGVERMLTTIAPDGSWPSINYEDVSRTGFQHAEHLGNMLSMATIWGKQGVFARKLEVLEEVLAIIASKMKTTTERGLKPDLSHHHRHDHVISTLSYGLYLPSQFATWAGFIAGTRFSFPPSATELVVDFFLDGVCRSMAYGRYPDPGARNRGISRTGALNPAGPEMAESLYRVSHHRRDELKAIADIRRGEREPSLRYTSFFWHSEYFNHQRPRWFASVRMFSARNHNVEYPHNEEVLLNHQAWASADELRADVFALWIDHGVKPQAARCQYIVVPGLERSAVESYRRALPVTILANSDSLQAVRHDGLDLVQLVFYEAGEIELDHDLTLSVDKPCAVMVKRQGNRVERITVADPSRAHDNLELTINRPIEGAGPQWQAAWEPAPQISRITVNLPRHEWAGRSVVLDGFLDE